MAIQKMDNSPIDNYYLSEEFQGILSDTLKKALKILVEEEKLKVIT